MGTTLNPTPRKTQTVSPGNSKKTKANVEPKKVKQSGALANAPKGGSGAGSFGNVNPGLKNPR